MPQSFSARPFAYPDISIASPSGDADTFWLRAQNLNRVDDHERTSKCFKSNKVRLCGFCQACFEGVLDNGDTKRIEHRSGFLALRRSAKYCSLCAFYRTIVARRCRKSVFENGDGFIVYARKVTTKQSSACPLLHVGFQIVSHCMVPMVFCSDTNEISNRAIWSRSKPKLHRRAHLFQKWLETCENNHQKCKNYRTYDRPSRILKIDPSNSVQLMTIQSTSSIHGYAALSHRWPSTSYTCLLMTSNVEQYKASIPVSQLPKTFTDAIQITKALGLTYLWIDSLCILQDCTKDWQAESAKMDAVYLNAAVTIAAHSSSEASRGCSINISRPTRMLLSLPTQVAGGSSERSIAQGTLRSECASPFAIADSELNQRGWVFQEMVLSSRILHLTQDQAYWQCREEVESEDGTLFSPEPDHKSCVAPMNAGVSRDLLAPNTIPEHDLTNLWWSWAIDYSSRNLTKAHDKLYALAGITKFYQSLSGSSTVVLGLLRERLTKDLAWRLDHTETHRRTTKNNLPSWSWLAWEGTLVPFMNEVGLCSARASILSADIIWSGEELTSPLKSAEICISGRCIPMEVDEQVVLFDMESHTANIHFLEQPNHTSETVSYIATACFDTGVPDEGNIVHCLELEFFKRPVDIVSEPPWSLVFEVEQKLLVLQQSSTKAGTFERLGVGTIRYERMRDLRTPFDNVEAEEITLT